MAASKALGSASTELLQCLRHGATASYCLRATVMGDEATSGCARSWLLRRQSGAQVEPAVELPQRQIDSHSFTKVLVWPDRDLGLLAQARLAWCVCADRLWRRRRARWEDSARGLRRRSKRRSGPRRHAGCFAGLWEWPSWVCSLAQLDAPAAWMSRRGENAATARLHSQAPRTLRRRRAVAQRSAASLEMVGHDQHAQGIAMIGCDSTKVLRNKGYRAAFCARPLAAGFAAFRSASQRPGDRCRTQAGSGRVRSPDHSARTWLQHDGLVAHETCLDPSLDTLETVTGRLRFCRDGRCVSPMRRSHGMVP